MKNIAERWKNIGELVNERNHSTPHRLAAKMDAIRSGQDDVRKATPTEIEHTDYYPLHPIFKDECYLPACKNTDTPAPNAILRSALFGVVMKGSRQYEKSVLKATFNSYTVKYTGEQLDQSDLDVWLECLQRCQAVPLGSSVRFSIYDFLRSIGRNTGKTDHEWVKSVFLRLRASDVEISDGKFSYSGSLIQERYWDEESGNYCLELNPKIAACFGDASWTGISKNIRLQLKGKPLTLWLHGFYCSHKKPHPMKVSTLKALCGSGRRDLYKFRYDLKKSLNELASVSGWQCQIDENDLVIIKK